MKTLYYVVEKELENIGGVEETTGYKDVRVYDIGKGMPKLVIDINIENSDSTLDELKTYVEETIQDEDFETELDKNETYTFVQL